MPLRNKNSLTLMNFWWVFDEFPGFPSFPFSGRGHKAKTRKSRKIFIFWFIALQCMWICVLTTFLTVSVLKLTKIGNGLNLIYSEGWKAFKTYSPAAWLATWLDHFEIDVVWTVFKAFLKLHFHISVFWSFWWIFRISEFSFFGIGHKTKTRKSQKIFIFWFVAVQCMWTPTWFC